MLICVAFAYRSGCDCDSSLFGGRGSHPRRVPREPVEGWLAASEPLSGSSDQSMMMIPYRSHLFQRALGSEK